MKLIKNAIVYRASLPAAKELEQHLAEKPFHPVLESMQSSSGFIPNPHTGLLVSEVAGGYSFRFRRDAKPLPVGALKLALTEQLTARAEELGRPLEKDEAEEVKDLIISNLIKSTLPERTEVDLFYHQDSRTLIVPSTSKDLAGYALYHLVEACGAVETSTIHVSDIKGGLTTRLRNHFDGQSEAFNGFKVGDSVVMKGKAGKASFDLDNLDHAKNGVIEALAGDMQAERLELVHADAISFKLTKDFHLRGIQLVAQEDDDSHDFDDMSEAWTHHAGVQVLLVVAVVEALCELFGYQEKLPASDSKDPADDEIDPLYQDAVTFVKSSGTASVSAVQRKLKIGYNRAARMIERMEIEQIITPMRADGSRELIPAP